MAQIILSHLQRRLSEAKRAQLIREKETVSGIIINLNRIRRFTDSKGTTYKTEVLDKQKDLLKALRIQEIRWRLATYEFGDLGNNRFKVTFFSESFKFLGNGYFVYQLIGFQAPKQVVHLNRGMSQNG